METNIKQDRIHIDKRIWDLLMFCPVLGTFFLIFYVKTASEDIVYSDYIRLINSYLPDTLSPESFFVSDILTRIPITYPLRWINVHLFGYSVDFDRMLGLMGIFFTMLVLFRYTKRIRPGYLSIAALMLVGFSLNKWELLINGSGYPHFISYGLFFYNYLVIERVFTGTMNPRDEIKLFILPYTALLVAGPYIVQYCLSLMAAFIYMGIIKKGNLSWKRIAVYLLSSAIPMLLFLISNSTAEYEHNVKEQLTLMQVLLGETGFTIHFILNGFASEVLCGDVWEALLGSGKTGYGVVYMTGALVILCYAYALILYFINGIYRKTLFPLLLIMSGVLSHLLVFCSRYLYLVETYAWQSRYSLQYLPGTFGILIIYGIVIRRFCEERKSRKIKSTVSVISFGISLAVICIFMAGSFVSTKRELQNAPYRKTYFQSMMDTALHIEDYTDDELNRIFEYNHGAGKVRGAFSILKENGLNIYSK
ncbi:hypothetical protein [Oribacterium sp. P6A1]|uniref:hypothetical protein n=1 Tax=Oribacterium sp. P6A1 TaxID=1410612 RepID=UPI0005618F12|nr:hypothetical protein [Oribacterium sp. P6A1]